MRRIAWVVGLGMVVVGVWALRTPTAALVQLKLALDGHDLGAVQRRIDKQALATEALGGLVEETPGGAEPIRLAVRGNDGWLPAIPFARSWLRLRLDRVVERLVEDPAQRLTISWEHLERTLDTLEQAGATAFFRFDGDDGTSYDVRMRQGWFRWRIVSVERDGQPLLLASPQVQPVAAPETPIDDEGAINGIVTEPPADDAVEPEPVDAEPSPADPETQPAPSAEKSPTLRLAPMVAPVATSPEPRSHWIQGGRPFVRRLDGTAWTVQVGSSTDALAAEVQRDRFTDLGQPAFVQEVTVRGTQWHRVLIGSFDTKRDAEKLAERLASGRGD
ncbi:MAG TPA: SPOR domain-containing protein [Candidatus Binatia bacterium]|jgi:cell division septation protein DedD|nr:SPOR domain-containing protein [Candidatus Binatia bacterium]